MIENSRLAFYIIFWAAWVVWVQTVGRLPHGLSLPVTLGFDALFITSWLIWYRHKKSRAIHSGDFFIPASVFISRFKEWWNLKPASLRGPLNWLAVAVLASIVLQVTTAVPLDWDGMDYHIPPLVESWKDGYWHHSSNPYFAARIYPKTASLLHLFWICHFGGAFGLVCSLFFTLLFWEAGLLASYRLLGKTKWVYLFWLAYPLVARQAVSGYVDLVSLSSLLAFATFVLQGQYRLSAIALALHGSIKFTNLASGCGALLGLIIWWKIQEGLKHHGAGRDESRSKGGFPFLKHRLRVCMWLLCGFFIFASIQPVENFLTEGKPFGPLQCKVLGYDFCNGDIDLSKMVVSPTIDIPQEASWLQKVIKGWIPTQIIPAQDVPTGGFGWAWLLPVVAFTIFTGSFRKTWKVALDYQSGRALGAVIILFFADLLVPALWYQRYHMALGWVLMAIAAIAMQLLRPTLYRVSVFLLMLQLLWVFPQRTWFWGVHGWSEMYKIWDNVKSLAWNGYPQHATHAADQRSIFLYGLNGKKIIVCGNELRPVLAAYGAKLKNDVRLFGLASNPACPRFEKPPDGWIGKTKYWIF